MIGSTLEKRLESLRSELEMQEKRFMDAAFQSSEKIQYNFALLTWIQNHPLHAAAVLFIGGFFAAQVLHQEPPTERTTS